MDESNFRKAGPKKPVGPMRMVLFFILMYLRNSNIVNFFNSTGQI